jgi:hypothetical protein
VGAETVTMAGLDAATGKLGKNKINANVTITAQSFIN